MASIQKQPQRPLELPGVASTPCLTNLLSAFDSTGWLDNFEKWIPWLVSKYMRSYILCVLLRVLNARRF